MLNYLVLNAEEYVVVDIESTGLSPDKGARIIEIGAWKIKNGVIVDKFSEFINPGQKIYKKTIDLTGITNEMLEGKPSYGAVLPKFYDFIKDSVIIAHNAKFDWDRFLLYFFKKVGLNPINEVIDTMEMSKDIFPKEKKHNLDILCERLNVSVDEGSRHRAIDDAKYTAYCLFEMMKIKGIAVNSLIDGYEGNKVQELFADSNKIKIKKVQYWEKKVSKKETKQRLYINLNDGENFGSVYFDLVEKVWYVQHFPISINLKDVEIATLKHFKLKTIDELCEYSIKLNESIAEEDIVIKRVKYWEKELAKDVYKKRIYIDIATKEEENKSQSIYFDVISKNWNKNGCSLKLDFDKVEKVTLKHLNLISRDDFINFKN